MRTRNIFMIALLAVAPCASAQLAIQWDTFDSGSGVLMNGGFEVHDTIGQPDAGELRTNSISASGGFWSYGYTFCLADITTQGAGAADPLFGVPDGLVTGADINYYVNFWVAGDITIADFTTQGAPMGDPNFGVPDGLITASDINFFVNEWVTGCP